MNKPRNNILNLSMPEEQQGPSLKRRRGVSDSVQLDSSRQGRSSNEDQDLQFRDAGNKPHDHYKNRLSSFRYKVRQKVLPIIRSETNMLARLQERMRHPLLDAYFAWTANLASHTFYVLMLPLPLWFGSSLVARNLIAILGQGIYLSGVLKDYFCLPRPRSPPLHRITMSSYTTQEYGFPSSHSANATGVTCLLLYEIFKNFDVLGANLAISLTLILLLYYVSLILGRLYCGMHGLMDVAAGSLIGILLFLFRIFCGEAVDHWVLQSHNGSLSGLILTPLLIIIFNLSLIHFHTEPADDCPCFDDSVAFIGVLIGTDLSHWICYVTGYLEKRNPYGDPLLINYDFHEYGVLGSVIRVLVGISLVVFWKSISKRVVYTILPPLYKFLGINIPRKYYKPTAFSKTSTRKIRSQSISNLDDKKFGDIDSIVKMVTEHESKDEVGPQNQIDVYEIMDYANMKGDKIQQDLDIPIAGVFKPRYDVEIIGRVIIYAGIAVLAIWGFVFATEFIGFL